MGTCGKLMEYSKQCIPLGIDGQGKHDRFCEIVESVYQLDSKIGDISYILKDLRFITPTRGLFYAKNQLLKISRTFEEILIECLELFPIPTLLANSSILKM